MIKYNRLEVLNVLNDELIVEIYDVVSNVSKDFFVCIVLFIGEGKVFFVGVDLNWMKWMVGYIEEENIVDVVKLVEMLCVIFMCLKLIIVIVNGVVMGGGVGFILVCDIVVVLKDVVFVLLEVWLGLILVMIFLFVVGVIGIWVVWCYFLIVECFSVDIVK